MSAPCQDVCTPWVAVEDLACLDGADVADEVLEEAVLAASGALYELTGRRWPGSCVETVRPCAVRPDPPRPAWGWTGTRRAASCGCSGGALPCGCAGLGQVELGAFPVTGVLAVTLDGAALDPSEYRVDDFRWLVRLDGRWPCCQDLSLPDTEEGTFSVRFTYGAMPPALGVLAARMLACQLAKATLPDEECELPSKVVNVVRQGVSMTLLEPTSLVTDGKTGIWEVDLFLGSYSPSRTTGADVLSIDVGPTVRRVGT